MGRAEAPTETRSTMAKKIQALVKLQCPAGAATPAPPVGTALGPHGVNIMEFVKQFNARTQSQSGMVIPCRGHDLRRSDLHVHHQDPAGPEPPPEGGGDREGERPAQPDQGGQGHPRAGQEDRRDQDGRSQRVRPRQRHEDDRRAPPGRWGWRWWTDADPGQEVQGRGRQGRSGAPVPDPRGRGAGEGRVVRQVRRDRGRRRAAGRRSRATPTRWCAARSCCPTEPASRFACW